HKFDFTSILVETKKDFINAIHDFKPEIILSDYNLPQFTGFEALEIAKKLVPDIPFIIVTGSLSEEMAADSIKRGAWDYVIKEKLVRLTPAIENALKLKEEKDKNKQAEEDIRKSEEQLRNIFENSTNMYYSHNTDHVLNYVSPQVTEILGYTPEEAMIKWTELASDNPINEIGFENTVKAIETGKRQPTYELELIRKDGRKIIIEVRESPLLKDGKTVSIVGSLTDITERKQAEEALKASNENFQQVVSNITTVVWKADIGKNGTFENTYISPVVDELLELPAGTIKNDWDKYFGYIKPEYLEQVNKVFKEAIISSGKQINCEYEILKDNGKTAWFHSKGRCFEKNGKSHVFGSTTDITEHKQAEEREREATELLQSIMDSATEEIIVATDLEGIILSWNEGARRLLGFESKEVVGKESIRIFQTEEYLKSEKIDVNVKNMIATGKPLVEELTYVAKDGRIFPAYQIVTPRFDKEGKFVGMLGLAKDITERKRAEEEIQKLSKVVETTPEAVVITDMQGKIEYVNKGLLTLGGFEDDNLIIGKSVFIFTNEEGVKQLQEEIIPTILSEGKWRGEAPVKRKDGSVFPTEMICSLILDEEGNPKYLLSQYHDITERKQAEEALKASEEKFKNFVNHSPDIIYKYSNERGGLFWSNNVKDILGFSPDEIINDPFIWANSIHPDDKENVRKAIEENKKGVDYNIEYRIKTKQGKWIWLHDYFINKSQIGDEIIIEGHATDITERKQSEKDLRESEEKFRAISESAIDSIFIKDVNSKYIHVNPAMEKLFGLTASDLIGKTDIELFGKEAGEYLNEKDKKVIEGEIFIDVYDKTIRGELHSFHTIKVPLKNSEGEITGICGIARDITERKQAEEALRESEVRFRKLLENISTVAVQGYNADGTIHYWNKANELIYGYTAEEAIGKNLVDLIIPSEMREDVQKLIKHGAKTGEMPPSAEMTLMRKDGKPVSVFSSHAVVQQLGKELELFCIDVDLTERKQAEEAILKSEEKYRLLADNSMDAVWQMDLKLNFTYISPSIKNMMGFTVEEWVGTRLSQHASTKEFFNMAKKALYAIKHYKKLKFLTFESVMLSKNGKEIPVEITSKLLFNKRGLPSGLQGTTRDITERIRAEQIKKVLYHISNAVASTDNLEKFILLVKEELGTIIDTTNFYVALYDKENDCITLPYFNDEKDNINEFSSGKTLTGLVIKQGQSMLIDDEEAKKLAKEGKIDAVGYDSKIWLGVPLKIKGKVIGAFVVQSYTDSNAYTEKDKEVMEIISHQISVSIEKKLNEERLIEALEKATESDRLKSAFLSTISHELRTPLNAIIGFSEIINEDIPLEDILDFVKLINQGGHNLFDIIEDILDITDIESNKSELSKTEFRVSSIFDEIIIDIELIQEKEDKKHLEIKCEFPADEMNLMIISNESKIKKVLIHLLRNAFKFTENGFIEYGLKPEKDKVIFYVKDTGVGIPENKQDIVFDKFRQVDDSFTRKFGGMGIGLTYVKKIIELLDGKVWFDSIDGKGSTFYFSIPIIVADKEKVVEAKTDIRKIRKDLTGKTILVAEDEESNFMLLRKILELENINIIRAVNGKQAVKKFKEIKEIDLILMDIKMPVMNGYEATVEIRKISDVPIFALSAFTAIIDREEAKNHGCNDFIGKPIRREVLLEKIGDILDA
ncbi:MAG: PAS domain S-box protein, partial [Bacteroidales bacterium]|nr:PAS domain S-box protein [Bacteroidales bacterium]